MRLVEWADVGSQGLDDGRMAKNRCGDHKGVANDSTLLGPVVSEVLDMPVEEQAVAATEVHPLPSQRRW